MDKNDFISFKNFKQTTENDNSIKESSSSYIESSDKLKETPFDNNNDHNHNNNYKHNNNHNNNHNSHNHNNHNLYKGSSLKEKISNNLYNITYYTHSSKNNKSLISSSFFNHNQDDSHKKSFFFNERLFNIDNKKHYHIVSLLEIDYKAIVLKDEQNKLLHFNQSSSFESKNVNTDSFLIGDSTNHLRNHHNINTISIINKIQSTNKNNTFSNFNVNNKDSALENHVHHIRNIDINTINNKSDQSNISSIKDKHQSSQKSNPIINQKEDGEILESNENKSDEVSFGRTSFLKFFERNGIKDISLKNKESGLAKGKVLSLFKVDPQQNLEKLSYEIINQFMIDTYSNSIKKSVSNLKSKINEYHSYMSEYPIFDLLIIILYNDNLILINKGNQKLYLSVNESSEIFDLTNLNNKNKVKKNNFTARKSILKSKTDNIYTVISYTIPDEIDYFLFINSSIHSRVDINQIFTTILNTKLNQLKQKQNQFNNYNINYFSNFILSYDIMLKEINQSCLSYISDFSSSIDSISIGVFLYESFLLNKSTNYVIDQKIDNITKLIIDDKKSNDLYFFNNMHVINIDQLNNLTMTMNENVKNPVNDQNVEGKIEKNDNNIKKDCCISRIYYKFLNYFK